MNRDPIESLRYQPCPGSRDLLILCSDRLAGYMSPQRFTWYAVTQSLDVNRLYLRDNFGLWYFGGLDGFTTGIEDTALFLAEFIEEEGFDRVGIIGPSAGGTAALLLGALIGADSIDAVSPRTYFVENDSTVTDFDRHDVPGSLERLHALNTLERQYLDLPAFFDRAPLAGSLCRVHYDPEHALDRRHAEHLAGVAGIEFITAPGAGHRLQVDLGQSDAFLRRAAFGA